MQTVPLNSQAFQIKYVSMDDILLKTAASLNISIGNDEIL
jgi:hypothetical protein